MKIDTSRFKENEIKIFEESLLPAQADLDTSEVKYCDTITLTTEAKKELQVLHTKTHVRACVEYICSRCCTPYADVIEKDFDIVYPLEQSQQYIDITNDIREEIILNYSVKFLCQPLCRGLCPRCGGNLNEGNCGCQTTTQLTE